MPVERRQRMHGRPRLTVRLPSTSPTQRMLSVIRRRRAAEIVVRQDTKAEPYILLHSQPLQRPVLLSHYCGRALYHLGMLSSFFVIEA